jgi:hypothetical protein
MWSLIKNLYQVTPGIPIKKISLDSVIEPLKYKIENLIEVIRPEMRTCLESLQLYKLSGLSQEMIEIWLKKL